MLQLVGVDVEAGSKRAKCRNIVRIKGRGGE